MWLQQFSQSLSQNYKLHIDRDIGDIGTHTTGGTGTLTGTLVVTGTPVVTGTKEDITDGLYGMKEGVRGIDEVAFYVFAFVILHRK